MRHPRISEFGQALLVVASLVVASGCGGNKKSAVPDPKTTAANLESAFKNAPSDVRTVVQAATESLRNNDAAGGFIALYGVTKNPELTPEQQRAAGDALLNSIKDLSAAAKNGDTRAEKALEAYRARK